MKLLLRTINASVRRSRLRPCAQLNRVPELEASAKCASLSPRRGEGLRVRGERLFGDTLISVSTPSPLPMNLVGDDVRRLIPSRSKKVRASLRRLLRFRGSRREFSFRRILTPALSPPRGEGDRCATFWWYWQVAPPPGPIPSCRSAWRPRSPAPPCRESRFLRPCPLSPAPPASSPCRCRHSATDSACRC